MAHIPSPERPEGGNPEISAHIPELLMDYIRTQFEAAYQKERTEDMHSITAQNGSFYAEVPVIGDGEHELVRNSTRVVMRAPFSLDQQIVSDEFAELYAVFLRGTDGHIVADEAGFFADEFLFREHSTSGFGSFKLINEEGVFEADINTFDAVGGFGVLEDTTVQDIERQIADVFRPITEATRIYDLISRYNIVATTD